MTVYNKVCQSISKRFKYYISVLCLRQKYKCRKYVIEMLKEAQCLFLISKSYSLENVLVLMVLQPRVIKI